MFAFGLNKSISDFPGMPHSTINWEEHTPHNCPIMEQLDYDQNEETCKYHRNAALFTQEQQSAFNIVIEHAIEKTPGEFFLYTVVEHSIKKMPSIFFLYAAGGCGKTFLSNTICN